MGGAGGFIVADRRTSGRGWVGGGGVGCGFWGSGLWRGDGGFSGAAVTLRNDISDGEIDSINKLFCDSK